MFFSGEFIVICRKWPRDIERWFYYHVSQKTSTSFLFWVRLKKYKSPRLVLATLSCNMDSGDLFSHILQDSLISTGVIVTEVTLMIILHLRFFVLSISCFRIHSETSIKWTQLPANILWATIYQRVLCWKRVAQKRMFNTFVHIALLSKYPIINRRCAFRVTAFKWHLFPWFPDKTS